MGQPSSRVIALIVASAFFMETLDATVIATALPAMAQDFGVTPVALSIGVTAYMLALAAFIPASGWVADRIGTRTVFASAIIVFTIASVLCAMSDGLVPFTAARILQGASAAMMSPVGRLVVLRSTPKNELVGAIAMITWPGLIGPVVGPALGGFIVTYWSWHWIFLINVPIGLVGAVLVLVFVENHRGETFRPFDTVGFALTATALGLLIYGLHAVGRQDTDWMEGGLILAAGFAIGTIAVLYLRRAAAPLVDLSIARIPTFALATLWAGSIMRLTSGAMPFLLPLFFQIGFGMTAFDAGLLVLAYAFGNLGMKSITTPILRRFGFRRVLLANGFLVAVTILFCASLTPDMARPLVIVILFVAGCVRSMQLTAIATLTFADVGPSQRSAATTFASLAQQLAMTTGVAVASVLLSISVAVRGTDASRMSDVDFRAVLVAMAALAFVSMLRFLSVHPDAGEEVSGYRRRKPVEAEGNR